MLCRYCRRTDDVRYLSYTREYACHCCAYGIWSGLQLKAGKTTEQLDRESRTEPRHWVVFRAWREQLRCDGCDVLYAQRPEGDLADLNHLCRPCAEACAAQLERDYGLTEGCSDAERIDGIDRALGTGRYDDDRPETFAFSPDRRAAHAPSLAARS